MLTAETAREVFGWG